MKRDPFYQQIISGLSRILDPDLFERCVADILRAEWPTLVPVRGGGDAGMDGAVGDGEGTAFPLVCTTGEDVIGNLTRSLSSYMRSGGSRCRVLLATSQELTPRRRQNLERRAKDKGFTLLQIYTQAAIADRLYHDPAWCRELLNLTGAPPALSVIPPTTRPLLDIPLIGRGADADWLRRQRDDCLLVGQPGCGKTFLLHDFAKAGGGLFVVGEDQGEIAADLRTQQPAAVILDDAHVHLDLLAGLRQMREQTGLRFSLIGCCWPGQQDAVREALNLAPAQVHPLEPLTREEILAIIRSIGIIGPDELLRELIDQSQGRPGLAVTLAHLCRQGGVREVALGDALSRSVRNTFEPLVGQHATELLAGFAIGGSSGVPMPTVARIFGLPLLQVRRDAAYLAAGGVIEQLTEDRLSVHPEGLRHALVRDVFFQGALSLPVLPFLAEAPDRQEVTRTLIGARGRGADVPDELLLPLLEEMDQPSLWGEYAALGERETANTLRRHPGLTDEVAGPALHYQPDAALARLLDAAAAEQTRSKPLHRLHEWIRTAEPGTAEAISRRRSVVRAVRAWLGRSQAGNEKGRDGRRAEVASQAMAHALSPQFERTSMDPGLGRTLRITRGTLSLAEVREMVVLWSEVMQTLEQIPPLHWQAILQAIDDWAFPARHGIDGTHPDVARAMQDLARQMVGDLAPFLSAHPGLLTSLCQRAEPLGLPALLPENGDFAILYPGRPHEDWHEAEKENLAATQALADRWAILEPRVVASQIGQYEAEADRAGLTWPRLTQALCYELAARISIPADWARTFAEAGLSGNLTRPFLEAAVKNQDSGWEALVRQFLDDPNQRAAALLAVLTMPTPPASLLEAALPLAGGFAQLIETCCLRNEVPVGTIRRLLAHELPEVREAAAIGLWIADRRGVIPEDLSLDWRQATLSIRDDKYWLGQVLSADPALAADWLRAQLSEEHGYVFHISDELYPAISSLVEATRISLLSLVPDCYGVDKLISWLVGDSPAVFAALLRTPHLKPHHLAPLGNTTEGRAAWMVVQALDAGYSIDEVAVAFLQTGMSWTGDESLMWQHWADRFDRLSQTGDERVRQVAERAQASVLRQRDQAQARERAEAVYGRRR